MITTTRYTPPLPVIFMIENSGSTAFIEWLKEAMKDVGIVPKALAARAGLSKSTVSMWLSGHRQPTKENVELIARVLVPNASEDMKARVLEDGLNARFFPEKYKKSGTYARRSGDEVARLHPEVIIEHEDGSFTVRGLKPGDSEAVKTVARQFANRTIGDTRQD